MTKAEKYIEDYTRHCSNEMIAPRHEYQPWLTPDHARAAVTIAREKVIEKTCRCYCDIICDKGRCGMCFHKNDSQGQVKNDFKYNECLELKLLRNSINND